VQPKPGQRLAERELVGLCEHHRTVHQRRGEGPHEEEQHERDRCREANEHDQEHEH
jgi:hypothetical protein